jgi:hypothetical protein
MADPPEILEEITPDSHPDQEWERGWYDYAGGLRFWDNGWTEHYAPPAGRQRTEINYWKITKAVAGGLLIGWFLVWLLAQAAPDTFYWPVKFVVEELPAGFE